MTVWHRQKEFNDEPLRPYGLTKRSVNTYYGEECEVAIVSCMPEGIGKSRCVSLEAFQFLSRNPRRSENHISSSVEKLTSDEWSTFFDNAQLSASADP